MHINLSKAEIVSFARKRDQGMKPKDAKKENDLVARMLSAAKRGYLTQDDLILVAEWKWRGGRTRQLCGQNTEAEGQEITCVSFAAEFERLRIGALLALCGVQWPMASVILHFAFPDHYPILDVRAMNTVGGSTLYTFEKWQEYCELCRATAKRHNVSMRTLDKALWASDKKALWAFNRDVS